MIDRDLPLKKEIASKIKLCLLNFGWSQAKLSTVTGIPKSTISDYLNCKTLINPGNVEKIANAFGVPKHKIDPSFKSNYNIINNDNVSVIHEEHVDLYNSERTVELPVVGSISCGDGILAFEQIDRYEETPASWLGTGEHFYLTAKGDSMKNARIEDGDLLLIRRQEDVENGEIAAVLIDEEAVLKRVYKNNGTVILQSENHEYQPIILNGNNEQNIRIIGKLKKVVLNF